jgi:membrane protease YdiL (CAAX protease family)
MINPVQFREVIFWILWSIGPVSVITAVSTNGIFQALGEGYLTVLSIANSAFLSAVLISQKFQDTISIHVERRRTPHSIEWAGILITGLAGVALSNWIIVVASIIGAATKPPVDKIRERLRKRSLPLRALRDGMHVT